MAFFLHIHRSRNDVNYNCGEQHSESVREEAKKPIKAKIVAQLKCS